jgi:hypothetical protein
MRHPSISERCLQGANEALVHLTNPNANSKPLSPKTAEIKVQEIDCLVEKIRDELFEVHATMLLFQNPNQWISAMQARGIARGSQFSYYLQKAIISASMQPLCRLWDRPQRNQSMTGFSELLKLLTEEMLDRLCDRAVSRLSEYKVEGLHHENECKRVMELRQSIVPNILESYDFYNGKPNAGITTSRLKTTRDKWISHNDNDFDQLLIDLALQELVPFYESTMKCFESVNAFVRDSDFAWDSMTTPIAVDVRKFLATTP